MIVHVLYIRVGPAGQFAGITAVSAVIYQVTIKLHHFIWPRAFVVIDKEHVTYGKWCEKKRTEWLVMVFYHVRHTCNG